MRFILLIAVSTFVLANSAYAQIHNPLADVLRSPSELKVAESDDQPTALMKRCFNAAHKEMRVRYNYWLQDIGEIDGFLASIERLHKIRIEMGPATNEITFVEQKLAFAKEIESLCEKANSKTKREALRQINEASTAAFRVHTELELAKLKIASASNPQK